MYIHITVCMVQIALNEQRMLPSLRAAGGLQRVIHLRPHHGAGLGLALCCGTWREKTKGSKKIPEVSPVSRDSFRHFEHWM